MIRNVNAGSANLDFRSPFSVAGPGCGLIELGIHGALPLQKQDLSLLKREIQTFISDGVVKATDAKIGVTSEGNYNVLINKVGFDKFQYLLHLTKPIEKGQTVALRFPSVEDVLQSKRYNAAKHRRMHVIDEATRTLCLEDLQSLLAWLQDDVLPATGYVKSLKDPNSSVSFKAACERRRRICWVSRRIFSSIGKDRVSPATTEVCKALYFGRSSFGKEDVQGLVPLRQKEVFSSVLAAQVREEMNYAIELDVMCGTTVRAEWSPRAIELLEAVATCASLAYAALQDSGSSLSSCMATKLCDILRDHGFSNADTLAQNPGAPDGSVENAKVQQGYDLAMALIAESPYDIDVDKSASMGLVHSVLQPPDDDGKEKLSTEWNRKLFWQITSTVMTSFSCSCNLDSDVEDFDIEKVLSAARPLVFGSSVVSDAVPISYNMSVQTPVSFEAELVPNSYPFFLGIVWPALRKVGWTLHCGSTPSEVSFSPIPRRRKRVSSLKDERDRKRLKLAREVNTIGLGVVPKKTKRLLAAVSGHEEICGPNTSCPPDEQQLTVQDILARFRSWLQAKVVNEEEHLRTAFDEKSRQIILSIEDCFDACAPMLSSLDGVLRTPYLEDGQKPIAAYGCEYLMQFLLMLPSVLRQADLPSKETSDCEEIARELLEFIAANYKGLLEKRFHPPPEKYVKQGVQSGPSFLESRLGSLLFKDRKADMLENSKDTNAGELTDMVLEEDKPGLTDFLITVLEQAIPYRATAEDAQKKGHRIYEGFPGVACRYCMGAGNQGKYFFRSLESLSTSYTVLEAHFLKCAPEEIRKKIISTRLRHTEQRKSMRPGSQQAFFNRLWDRLRTSKIAGQPGIYVKQATAAEEDDVQITRNGSESQEFTDHISVLDYVRSGTAKTNNELEEALDRYYSCLDYAGRVYNTPSMPKHFSSVWLLAKVLPKDQHHTPQRNVG